MSKTTSYLIVSCGAAALLFGNVAYAADAVIEEDPAPPDPVVQAAPVGGFYIGARIGAAFADDTEFGTLGTQVQNAYDTGYTLSGVVGYDFKADSPISFRAEAELGYAALEIDQHTIVGTGTFSGGAASGDTSSLFGLANGYIDYEFGNISPYIGAGIGYASVDFSGHGTTPTGTVLSDTGDGLAWQVGAGASYALTESVKLDLGYRYFNVEDVDLTATDATQSQVDFRNHQITLGIRKAF